MASSQSNSAEDLETLRQKALEFLQAGKLAPAYKRLRSYIFQVLSCSGWKAAFVDPLWIETLKTYADCCHRFGADTIELYQLLELLGLGDASTASSLGYLYRYCELWYPALDCFRLAYVRESSNLTYRLQLAMELVTCPDYRLRNATEAARLLNEAKDLPVSDDVLAIKASIAAENQQSFDAKNLQCLLVERSTGINKILQNLVLERYHQGLRFPGFIEREIRPQHQLWHTASILLGTPMVYVRGRVMYEFDDGEPSVPRVVEHLHKGMALTSFGDILICCTSLSIPPYADSDGRKACKARWLEGPFIKAQGERAEVIGTDHASGLALIRMERIPNPEKSRSVSPTELTPTRPLTSEPIPNLETIRQLIFDSRPRVNHRQELEDETVFNTNGLDVRWEIQEVGMGMAESLAIRNHWNESEQRNVGTWVRVKAADLIVGAPLVNQATERVAMIDEVYTDEGPIKVGIPAEVISRVAAKLLCFGTVERASMSIRVSAVDLEYPKCEPFNRRYEESGRLRGMEIKEVSGQPELEQELTGLIITHVDDVPTPDDTAWQIALEKAAIMKQYALECVVYDAEQNSMKAVSIPIDPRQ